MKKQAEKTKPKSATKEEQQKPEETAMEFTASIASVFVIGLFIITFIVQAFEIPSGSMLNTLLIGDHVFVDRVRFAPQAGWAHWLLPYRAIKRGDIVVFLSVTEPGMFIVKRIRGVPGDHLHLQDGKLYVNGQLQNEPFVLRTGQTSTYADNFPYLVPTDYDQVTPEWRLTLNSHLDQKGELNVPPGYFFAMGDNRDNSYDSRFWGFVPQANVIGRPLFIYWSFITSENEYKQQSIADRVGFLFHIVVHFFDQTRWKRTLRMVR